MPTLLLYLFVPFMSAMRVWSRFGVLVMQSVAVLAACGLDGLLKWHKERSTESHRQAHWVGIVLILLLLLDFSCLPYAYGYTEVRGQPADRWLAGRNGREAIIHYPLDKTWYGWMLYPQRIHERPIAYGYGTFAPLAYERAAGTLREWPSEDALALIESWGVRYILVGARSYGTSWPEIERQMAQMPNLQEVGVFQDRPLFQDDRLLHLVRPSADVPSTELVSGELGSFLEDEIHVYELW
jgi:hypothetical protein